jgi:hypothetical protein
MPRQSDLNLVGKRVQLLLQYYKTGPSGCELLLTQILGARAIISQVSMRRQDFIPQLCSPSNQKRDFLKDQLLMTLPIECIYHLQMEYTKSTAIVILKSIG